MPSNAAATTTTTFKTSDFDYDAAANKMSEDRLDQDRFRDEKLPSAPTRKVGRPGRKRKQLAVASCEASKEGVVGSKGRAGPGGQSLDQVPNGELGGHGGGAAAAASSRQDRSVPENGVPRDVGPARLLENGLLSLPDEQDCEGPAPSTPRKKRGRRKLEHPEKLSQLRLAATDHVSPRVTHSGERGWKCDLVVKELCSQPEGRTSHI
ncbi:hypothetical protein AAFF_G00294080 [Aldrovandia affinis]|uniref:DNA (cytosine-5)-methyltransferase N-terminal domain-containing protein n=1 Tax=Aldrovandia affinis TaxID=143900 RepID=A0AAD7R9A4_9TELE|nr:hypothetical protein AAFF_G00294080 [Aldrovandia affinis]